ncbi:MAG: hypothetical protein KJ697_02605 [Nanoarchaeota archaeon]|nr:hypothetical protein [Nanoarchaeota archaeon]MBU4124044.1 hypothetical protein [Nanoarchaeota archaeon]
MITQRLENGCWLVDDAFDIVKDYDSLIKKVCKAFTKYWNNGDEYAYSASELVNIYLMIIENL